MAAILEALSEGDTGSGGGEADARYFCSTYLDSPVLITVRTQFFSAVSHLEDHNPKFLALCREGKRPGYPHLKNVATPVRRAANLLRTLPAYTEIVPVDPDEYASLYNIDWRCPRWLDLDGAASVARELYVDASKAVNMWVAGEGVRRREVAGVPQIDKFGEVGEYERHLYQNWATWHTVTEDTAGKLSDREKGENVVRKALMTTASGRTVTLVTDGNYVLVQDPRQETHADALGRVLMLTWDQALMVKDLLYSRAQVLTSLRVLYPSNNVLFLLTVATFRWHEKCLTRYFNEGFEILRQSESLAKAALSRKARDEFGEDGPFWRMVEKVRAKERALGATDATGYLADEYASVLDMTDSISDVVELFGLLKVSGHPLIDPERGGRSAAAIAMAPDPTLPEDARRINWNFKRIFLEAYVRRHGSWPNLIFTSDTTELAGLYKRQKLGITRHSYPLSDWSSCRFTRAFEFDYAANFLELMDDKSISYYRSNVAANWNRDVPKKSHRRLLLELIERKELDMKQVAVMVMRRQVPLDWLIVSLYPKEREFKLAPRMFSMMVMEMRSLFAMLEMNLATQVFPYLPQQTMTKSKNDISKMFLDFTRPSTVDDQLTLFLEIDLSRWNLRWRELTVHGVGETLDDLFDTPGLYTYIHTFFRDCMILVRVSDLPPPGIEMEHPKENSLLWYNHLGGFEGIVQKHWTICTYCMVDLAFQPFPLSYQLFGQGDNQIVAVRGVYTSHEAGARSLQLRTLRDELVEAVRLECAKVNQEVKPEECLESTRVVTYSKDVYVNGVYYPTSLKFHSRLFPHSSQDFPSIRTNLGAIYSTGLTAAERSENPFRSLYLCHLQAALYLKGVYSGLGVYGAWAKTLVSTTSLDSKSTFRGFVKYLLTLPSELGGFPITSLTGFMYKSGSDPLSKAVASLILLCRGSTDRLYDRMLAQLDARSTYAKSISADALIQDPYSIPLDKPVTPIDGVTQLTMEALVDHIKNQHIHEIVSRDGMEYSEHLMQLLATVTPFNPLILRDIFECSVAGVLQTIGKMFVATRTLQSVARETSADIIPRVLQLERENLAYLGRRYNTLPTTPWRIRTVYQEVIDLRKWWEEFGCPFPEGITTYSPFDFRVACGSGALGVEGITAVVLTHPATASLSRGPYDPYIGGKTKEKRSEHGYRITGHDTTSEAFRKLQLISAQTGEDPMFKLLVDSVGLTRSNTQLSSISERLPVISGGTLSHRYAARAGHQEAYTLGSSNFATHCLISSDNTGELSGGRYDYPVMFQEWFIVAIWCLQYLGSRYLDVRALTIVTEGCVLSPLPSVEVTMPIPEALPHLSVEGNPLAFLDHIRLQKVSGVVAHHSVQSLRFTPQFKATRTMRRHAYEAWFSQLLRDQSLGRQAIDAGRELYPSTTLDIADVIGVGIEFLIESAARALADEILVDGMKAYASHRRRREAHAYAVQAATPLAHSFSSFIPHPLVRSDPAVRRHGLYELPKYGVSYSRVSVRVSSLIAESAMTHLDTMTEGYTLRTVGVYQSERESRTLEAALAAVCRAIAWEIHHRSLTRHQAQHLVGRFLLPVLRLSESELVKVDALCAVLTSLMAWSTRVGARVLVVVMRGILSGTLLHGYKMSVPEFLRSTRTIEETAGMILPLAIRPVRFRTSDTPPGAAALLTRHPSPAPRLVLHLRPAALPRWEDAVVARVRRHSGHLASSVATAHDTWVPFARILGQSTCIIIGSGQGGAAAVAIKAGAAHVYGLDLRETLPLHPHRFTSYVPAAVLEAGGEAQYTQLPASYLRSGNWLEKEVQAEVLEYDSGDTTFVVDIEAGVIRLGLEVLRPLAEAKIKGVTLWRMFCTDEEADEIAGVLYTGRVRFRMYNIEPETEGTRGRIWLLTGMDSTLRTSDWVIHLDHPSPSVVEASPPTSRALILSECCNHILTPRPAEDDASLLLRLCSLHTTIAHADTTRIGYNKWTSLLRAYLSLSWCLLTEGQGTRLRTWRDGGVASIPGVHPPILVTYSPALERHLTGVTSRLLTDRQVQVLAEELV